MSVGTLDEKVAGGGPKAAAPTTPAPALSPLDALHAASDAAVLPTKVIPVPELGGLEVEVWGLSAADRSEMWASCYRRVEGAGAEDGEGDEDAKLTPIYDKLYPFLLTRCVRLPGTPTLVYQGKHADPAYINARDPAMLDRFVAEIFRLSGLGKESKRKEKNGSRVTGS